jgi:hypothetical protein
MCTCTRLRLYLSCPCSRYSFCPFSTYTAHITSGHVSVDFLALTVQLQTLNPSRQPGTRGPSETERASQEQATSESPGFSFSARRDETGIIGARDHMAWTGTFPRVLVPGLSMHTFLTFYTSVALLCPCCYLQRLTDRLDFPAELQG